MGFGAMFLGFMFLYDFQLGLRAPGSDSAYALLDIFPDAIGWVLLFFGLRTLSKKDTSFAFLRNSTVFFFILSLFSLAKETLFFTVFYSPAGSQTFVGQCVDICEHLLTLGFIWLLFRKTAPLCRKNGEDKLSRSHDMLPRVAATEGGLYLIALLFRCLPLPAGAAVAVNVISRLDFLFWVFLIWFGTITLFRSMRRLSD